MDSSCGRFWWSRLKAADLGKRKGFRWHPLPFKILNFKYAVKVVRIETNPSAVADANRNGEDCGMKNFRLIVALVFLMELSLKLMGGVKEISPWAIETFVAPVQQVKDLELQWRSLILLSCL
ncbi:hypothetical protein R6Q59_028030 [Mikania micrantha]